MADWIDSLSDAEVSALHKFTKGGVDSLSDDEVGLIHPYKDKLSAMKQGPSFGSKALDVGTGIGQAAATMITGAAAMPLGFLAAGMQKLNNPSGINFEQQTAANMNAMTYEPSRELGQEYVENIGKVLNDIGIPAMAHMGGTHLPTMGNISTQMKARFAKGSEVPTSPNLAAAHAELAKPVEVPKQAPIVDTKPGLLKSKEAYEAAVRERELARTSAFSHETEALRAQEQQRGMQQMGELKGALDDFDQQGRVSTAEKALAERQRVLEEQVKKAIEDNPRPTQPILDGIAKIQEEVASLKQAQEEARLASNSERTQGMHQMEIDDTQHVLPDTNQVIAPQYGAMEGVGRIDENGIPIKADISMEAQNVGNLRQRGLWGEELGPKSEQEAPLGVSHAIDTMKSMPWFDARDTALGRLTGDLKAPELETAVGHANAAADALGPLGSLERKAKVAAKKPLGPKGQRGVIDSDLLGVGAATKTILAIRDGARGMHLSKMLEKFKGTFDTQSLLSAYKESTNPKATEHVVFMSPKEFNSLAMSRGSSHWTSKDSNARRAGVKTALDSVDGISGIPLLEVDSAGKAVNHDGRHRMDVLDANRVDLIPVRIQHKGIPNSKFSLTHLKGEDMKISGNKIRGGENNTVVALRNELSSPGPKDIPSRGGFPTDGMPAPVEKAFLRLKEASRRPNEKENPHGTTAYRQALTKAKNAFNKAVEEAGLDPTEAFNNLSELHGKPGEMVPVKIPFNYKNQGGGIRLKFDQENEHRTLSKIPGVKGELGDLLPDQRPVEQYLKEEAASPDVQQNVFQRIANNFTKGGVYQAIKTGNSLIKRVVDHVLDASNTARGEVAYWIHDKLAPAALALSKQEKADVWAMQVLAEKRGAPLTPEFLAKHGFNEKQINWVSTHSDVMKAMLGKMNEAMDNMGMPKVSPAMAYLASRASGDFRRLIYKDGEPVSILGADTRRRLDADVKKLQSAHPEWVVGEERFFGGGKRGGTAEGFTQMLELIGKDNPDVKLLADHVNELLTKDAFDYMGAKTHTMHKKGIEGMVGRKTFENAVTNAEEGMKAQISYAEKMIEWAEMSKAIKEIKPLLHADNGLNMPMAKQWSKDYIQNALGNNPSAVGRKIDAAFAEMFHQAGYGPTFVGHAPALAKKAINGLLLGFVNIPFQAMNLLQPFKSQPEMMAFLKGRGLEKSFDAGTGYKYLMDGIKTAWLDIDGKSMPAYKAEAIQYAKDKHVYSSDLFDASNRVSKDFGHYWDKGTQVGASAIEMRTRQITFLGYVELLHENGLKKADGLYDVAHKLTNIQMNNYNHVEAPKAYMVAGGIGKAAYNLMSYKHNEYSRLAMLANEIGRNKSYAPLMVNLMSSVAFAGVMGTIAYAEADALTKFISAKLGKPTSLTKILLDNPDIPDNIKFGLGSSVGLDLSSRMGTGPLVPQNPIDAVMPGAGKLVNVATSAYDAVTHPSEFNTKNAVREALPNSVGGLLDRAWFSKKPQNGNELALSRNTGKPTATRNESDKVAKMLGFTGLNEAKQKSKNYEESQINKVYAEKQKAAIDYATKAYNISGKIPSDFAAKYIKAQGDPSKFEATLNKMIIEGAMDQHTAQLLYNAASPSITSTHKLLRLQGLE